MEFCAKCLNPVKEISFYHIPVGFVCYIVNDLTKPQIVQYKYYGTDFLKSHYFLHFDKQPQRQAFQKSSC